jgi:single-strand DNA-binding protein
MPSINQVTLRGRVGREPRWGKSRSGALACRLLLATDISEEDEVTGKVQQVTEWNMAIIDRQLAEQFRDKVNKGDEVLVEGRMKTRCWTDDKGTVRYITEVFAYTMRVYPKKRLVSTSIADPGLADWVADYDEWTPIWAESLSPDAHAA